MSRFLSSKFLPVAAGFTLATLAWLPLVAAEAAPPASAGRSAEHARIVEHWTPARRAAATPRDFVLDEAGNAFLKLPHGGLELYGRPTGGAAQPMAKPGGGGGGNPTEISGMDPASGVTIGANYTFKAKVTDLDGVRSVAFSIRKGTARAQNFSATLSNAAEGIWSTSLQGFSDGDWSWQVVAKDATNTTTSSAVVSFKVATGGGGSGGGGGDGSVTNSPWTKAGDLQTAAGRIYFEMPSNSRRTRWAGYVCSGTVVTDGTSGRSVILTAAHCVYDDANKAFARNVLFIPNQDQTTGTGTDRNCDNDPLGCWTPNFGVVDVNWTTRTFPNNKAWDYAYYVVSDSGRHTGTSVSDTALDVTAKSVGISFAAPQTGVFTYALGYSYSDDPLYMYCAANMTTEGADNWWVPGCGLSGGSSGGSWSQDDLPTTGTGAAMSVNSWGYTTSPGMAGPKLDGTSASRLFCRARTEVIGSVPTSDGNAGVTVSAGTATCP